ncbi:unnamed protein product [Musa textilis]
MEACWWTTTPSVHLRRLGMTNWHIYFKLVRLLSGSSWCWDLWATGWRDVLHGKVEEEMEKEKGDGSCEVKILLTRKELAWLELRLKEKGEQRLEDVLVEMGREMQKERGKSRGGWKPTLESIVEIPEVQTCNNVAV